MFCNRVSAVGAGRALLSSDIGCLTNTLALEIDLVNEDGAIVGGAFTPEPEIFHVGDGGPDRPDALVYRVVVANHHCGSLGFPLGDSSLTSIVGARASAVEFREVLAGFPSRGSIASSTTGGFIWSIGPLAPGEEAEIRFRVEAIRAGEDVHRVELAVPPAHRHARPRGADHDPALTPHGVRRHLIRVGGVRYRSRTHRQEE